MMPFVLMGRTKLPPESAPSGEEVYDEQRQLWINKKSGIPLVSWMQAQAQPETAEKPGRGNLRASEYGETTVTKTREGADQTESSTLQATQFGETTVTATREGADQTEGAPVRASQFGETTLTKTGEG